jgi:hypothetical protein
VAERLLAAALVAAHLAAASLPCTPGPRGEAGASHPASAHGHGNGGATPAAGFRHGAAARSGGHRPVSPCHGPAPPELVAPCPCGCDDAGAAGPGLARLERALPGTALRPPPVGPPDDLPAFGPRAPRARVRGVDHVPRPT